MNKTTNTTTTKEHVTLAGLRSRLAGIVEAAEKSIAFLDNPKQWRVVASLIDDINNDSETASQQINELL